MPHLDRFEDRIEREHCRLDYHKALEAGPGAKSRALEMWARRWGEKVTNEIVFPPSDDDYDQMRKDLAGAEKDADDAENRFQMLENRVTRAIGLLEKETPDVQGALTILEEA